MAATAKTCVNPFGLTLVETVIYNGDTAEAHGVVAFSNIKNATIKGMTHIESWHNSFPTLLWNPLIMDNYDANSTLPDGVNFAPLGLMWNRNGKEYYVLIYLDNHDYTRLITTGEKKGNWDYALRNAKRNISCCDKYGDNHAWCGIHQEFKDDKSEFATALKKFLCDNVSSSYFIDFKLI